VRPEPPKGEYRRNLPHLQPDDRTFFVTFSTWRRWQLPESVRHLVLGHCLHDHGLKAWIHGAVVMPDHVHLVLAPLRDTAGRLYSLADIMSGIKGASAHSVNRALCRKDHVWQDESFDHVLRNNESIDGKRPGDYPWSWRDVQQA
jgi:REP element-mobilizing transposase RayT